MATEKATVLTAPAADDPVLAEVVYRLVAAYQPERIYLFGSVARGDAGLDDVLVRTISYFEDRRLLRASLPGTVLREGRLVYGA